MSLTDFLNNTQSLAVWGAISGTIGTISGVLGLWLRYRQQKLDQAKLQCEAVFDFEVSNGVPSPKYKIVARSIGRRPVILDVIEYFYNPKSVKDRLIRRSLWKSGKWRSRDDVNVQKTLNLSEGQKADLPIDQRRHEQLGRIARVHVRDQTGRSWPVTWPSPRQLVVATRHDELDRIEEDNARRNCKIVGYCLKDDLFIFASWNKVPPNKSSWISRTFRFNKRADYKKKMESIRADQLPMLMSEAVHEIT